MIEEVLTSHPALISSCYYTMNFMQEHGLAIGFTIHVETGRYKNTPRDQRCCLICNINGDVEDEIHFLLKCPQYKNIRDNLFTYATSIIPEFDDLK